MQQYIESFKKFVMGKKLHKERFLDQNYPYTSGNTAQDVMLHLDGETRFPVRSTEFVTIYCERNSVFSDLLYMDVSFNGKEIGILYNKLYRIEVKPLSLFRQESIKFEKPPETGSFTSKVTLDFLQQNKDKAVLVLVCGLHAFLFKNMESWELICDKEDTYKSFGMAIAILIEAKLTEVKEILEQKEAGL